MIKRWILLLVALLLGTNAWAQFDQGYTAWDGLLKQHVRWLPDQKQSRVNYSGFAVNRTQLKRVLDAMSAVSQAEFGRWTRAQQMAFLVNAYNAFTIELILTRWPDLNSIKDLGSLLQSPWKKEFFVLLGEKRHLDWIEHDQLRPRYKDPRVHAAVNCASIGCPALRNEAFVAPKLEAQLDDSMMRFMSDRTRNRVAGGKLEVNMIFKWFREDWEQGWLGFNKLDDLFARYAMQLTDKPDEQQKLRDRALSPGFLDYDWSLNAAAR